MKSLLVICSVLTMCFSQAQGKSVTKGLSDNFMSETKPKLVVGIIVDQMRYDYLTRFYNRYSQGGFKRLIAGGFNCKNTHYNYVPTYTGPGHASVFTGTTPKYHGIISNYWYDKYSKKTVYVAGDDSMQAVGTTNKAGKMSPHRMKTTTFADQNRLFTQFKGKTIGISIKDRGAILPAGHTANGAYWFHGKDEGRFISSSFYFNELPKWVQKFNNSGVASSYLKLWETLYPISTYAESGSDLNTFEGGFKGQKTATFPYDLKTLSKTNKGFDIIKSTPYGNSIVADFAIKAIEAEQLGADNYTDVLTVSFSSTDYVGHNFGVNSKEIEDTYLRLDKDLERLLNTLDSKVGNGNYTVFLTADHGGGHVSAFLNSKKIPAGYFEGKGFKTKLNTFLMKRFGAENLIEDGSNNQLFLDHDRIANLGLNLANVQKTIVNEVVTYKGIDKAYAASTLHEAEFTKGIAYLLQMGYNQKRSGDVLLVLDPAVVSYSKTGSTHGSGLNYDTHVPLLFYGSGIKKGSSLKRVEITDIAPTISALLETSFPNGSVGKPLEFVIK